MVAALLIVTAGLVAQLLFVLWNVTYLKRIEAIPSERTPSLADEQSAEPFLSVLIPARNEELNIGDCLDSVLAALSHVGERWRIEVIVLDDHSTDATAALVAHRAAAAGLQSRTALPAVRLQPGADLPAGWLGKSWACHQLAGHARGRWLLFLDADTRLEPTALVRVCETAARLHRGMLTGFPRQIVHTALERLVVPLMSFTIACHLPIRFVRASRDPKFAAAHGAFICIARESYDACGGHERFRAHLVDDVMLARAVKRAEHPLHLLDVTDLLAMRMYRTNGEVWRGFKKNMFPGIGRNHILFATILTLYSALYVFPTTALIFAFWNPALLPYALAAFVCGVLVKWRIDVKQRVSAWHSLLLPISIIFMLLIMADSWRTAWSGRTYEWKGRQYS